MLLLALSFIPFLIFSMDPPEPDKENIMRLELATRLAPLGSYALLSLDQLKEEKLNQLSPEIQPLYRFTCQMVRTELLIEHVRQINHNRQNQLAVLQNTAEAALESGNKKRNG
jgi:hypothetical protein